MGAKLYETNRMMTTAIKFKRNPVFAMVVRGTWPVAKTTAFGPVAIGSIKAQLAAKASGAAIISNGIPVSIAIAPITGINAEAVAILLVTSVRAKTAAAISKISTGIGYPTKKLLVRETYRHQTTTKLPRVSVPL